MLSSNTQTLRQLFHQANWQELIKVGNDYLKHCPESSETKRLIGIAHLNINDLAKGIAFLEEARQAEPNELQTLNALAIAFEYLGNNQQALNHYQQALKLFPDSPQILSNMAGLYTKLDMPCEAISSYEKSISLAPDNPQVLNNLTALLYKQKCFDEALHYAQKAYAINPKSSSILNNYGNCLNAKFQYREAIILFKKALRLSPHSVEVLQNMGFAYHNLGDFDTALKCYNKSLAVEPKNLYAIWQRAFTYLLNGEFSKGWKDYEIGLTLGERPPKSSGRPTWNPKHHKNENVLITLEQGIGDQVMFCSCLPQVLKEAKKVSLECEQRLAPIFKRSFPQIHIIPLKDEKQITGIEQLPDTNYQLPMGSLPGIYRNQLTEFAQQNAYLKADDSATELWKRRFDTLGKGMKIGLSWFGGGERADQLKRRIALTQCLPFLSLPNCHFINLQYGDTKQEIATLKKEHNITLHEWDDSKPYENLDFFAAKIAALDLVISIGNSNVHLAGALGKTTWCLIPCVPSWRWLLNGSRSVWYPSVQVYRQQELFKWDTVIAEVTQSLKQHLAATE